MNTNAIFKWAVGIVVVVVLFFWINLVIENRQVATTEPEATSTEPVAVNATTLVYQDPAGFSFSYPSDFVITPPNENGLFATGTSFLVPQSLTEGTNLSSDSRLYVETRNMPKGCAPASSTKEVINGTTFSKWQTSDAGAGNLYTTLMYTTPVKNDCALIELFVHSTNIQNYDPGTKKEFDQDALYSALQTVLESFKTN